MGKTIADELMDKGRKQEAVRSRRQILLALLGQRFGDLPEQTVAAIQSNKSIRELDMWLGRVVTATTLEEIGIGE